MIKTIFKTTLICSTAFIFFSCEQEPTYEEEMLSEYKAIYEPLEGKYLEKLKIKYKEMERAPKMFVADPVKVDLDLENKTTLSFCDNYEMKPFNTLLLAGEFYGYDEEPKFPLVGQQYLKVLREWVKGDSLQFPLGDINSKVDQIKRFDKYCKRFLGVEYVIVIQRDAVELPHYIKNTNPAMDVSFEFQEAYEQGSMMVLQLEGNKGMAFMKYKSAMPDNLEMTKGQSLDDYLMSAFFRSVSSTKMKELRKSFKVEGILPFQQLARGTTIELEVKK